MTEGLAERMDLPLNLAERHFFYMPLVHAEDPKLQALSLKKFAAYLREARSVVKHQEDHAAVIARFGRFPTRNAALGRATTPEERAFLDALAAKAKAKRRKNKTQNPAGQGRIDPT